MPSVSYRLFKGDERQENVKGIPPEQPNWRVEVDPDYLQFLAKQTKRPAKELEQQLLGIFEGVFGKDPTILGGLIPALGRTGVFFSGVREKWVKGQQGAFCQFRCNDEYKFQINNGPKGWVEAHETCDFVAKGLNALRGDKCPQGCMYTGRMTVYSPELTLMLVQAGFAVYPMLILTHSNNDVAGWDAALNGYLEMLVLLERHTNIRIEDPYAYMLVTLNREPKQVRGRAKYPIELVIALNNGLLDREYGIKSKETVVTNAVPVPASVPAPIVTTPDLDVVPKAMWSEGDIQALRQMFAEIEPNAKAYISECFFLEVVDPQAEAKQLPIATKRDITPTVLRASGVAPEQFREMVSAWLERYYNMMAKQAEARDDVPDAPVHEDVLGEF